MTLKIPSTEVSIIDAFDTRILFSGLLVRSDYQNRKKLIIGSDLFAIKLKFIDEP
jgi:hypothetical protein